MSDRPHDFDAMRGRYRERLHQALGRRPRSSLDTAGSIGEAAAMVVILDDLRRRGKPPASFRDLEAEGRVQLVFETGANGLPSGVLYLVDGFPVVLIERGNILEHVDATAGYRVTLNVHVCPTT